MHRVLTIALVLSGTLALAQPRDGRGPPPEALQACANLSVNAACTMSIGGRTVTGTCASPPDGQGALACRPEGMPPGGHHGPPPEALQACASLAANAACSFSHQGRSLTGTCFAPPSGGALACRPNGPPR